MSTADTLYVALTADVDPDANRAVAGSPRTVSAGAEDGVRVEGCIEGLGRITDMLLKRGWPSTLFWEGRTLRLTAQKRPELLERLEDSALIEHGCHGMHHEDFAGKKSGRPLNRQETTRAMQQAVGACREHLGAEPKLFRAPYCRLTDELVDVLLDMEFCCDASHTAVGPERGLLLPYDLRTRGARTLWEAPLCRWKDPDGEPMDSYLWPLLEGSREVNDYIHLLDSVGKTCGGGLLQFALHPWHLCVGQDGSARTQDTIQRNMEQIGRVLGTAARRKDVKFLTVGDYLEGCLWS